jgi:hypothetical protein
MLMALDEARDAAFIAIVLERAERERRDKAA